MRPLIVANWKMNPQTLAEAKRLFNLVKRGIKNIKNVEVVICPPYTQFSIFNYRALAKVKKKKIFFDFQFSKNIKLGAQDIFWEQKGAFTGEVSPLMLKDLGGEYVIVGHSERREYFNETDEIINKKMKAALKIKLKPIFCIGETLKEKEKGETSNVLRSQIEKGLSKIPKKEIKNIIIAYEPVWAIGVGKSCSVDEAMTESLFIRKVLAKIFSPSISKNIRIIYGGSVNSKNAGGFVKEAGMDGLLVGGASLDPKEFVKIIKTLRKT